MFRFLVFSVTFVLTSISLRAAVPSRPIELPHLGYESKSQTLPFVNSWVLTDGNFWVSSQTKGIILASLPDFESIKTYAIDENIYIEAFTSLNGTLYVWDYYSDYVMRVDLNDTTADLIPLFKHPKAGRGITGMTSDEKNLILGSMQNESGELRKSKLFFIDPVSFKVKKTVSISEPVFFDSLAYSDGIVWLGAMGYVTAVNATTGKVIQSYGTSLINEADEVEKYCDSYIDSIMATADKLYLNCDGGPDTQYVVKKPSITL